MAKAAKKAAKPKTAKEPERKAPEAKPDPVAEARMRRDVFGF